MRNIFGGRWSFLANFWGLILLLLLGLLNDTIVLSELDHLKLILDKCIICFVFPGLFLLVCHLPPLFADHFADFGYLLVTVLGGEDGPTLVVIDHVGRKWFLWTLFLFFGSFFILLAGLFFFFRGLSSLFLGFRGLIN